MKRIGLPDGTVADFPDTMSDDEIKAVLRKKFPPATPEQAQAADEFRQFASKATQNPAGAVADMQPTWKKPLIAAADMVDLAANGATMGFGNKAAAAIRAPFTDKTYEEELARMRGLTEGARRRAGVPGMIAEIAGGVGTGLGAASKGATLAGRLGSATMPGVKGLALRSGLMGAEGGVYGALSGAGNADPGDELSGAVSGAGTGLVAGAAGNVAGEAIASTVGKVAGLFNKRPKRMTVDQIKQMASDAYDASEKAGVIFNKQGTRSLYDTVRADLANLGYDPDPAIAPGVKAALTRLQRLSRGENATLKGLEVIRRVASNGYKAGDDANNMMVSKVIEHIDDFVNNLDRNTLLMGKDPQAAIDALQKARNMWSTARKIETVERLARRGEIMGGSQLNQDVVGATKRQMRTLMLNEAKGRGFTPDEMAGVEKIVMGTPATHTLDLASKLLPSGTVGLSGHAAAGATNLASGNVAGLALQGAMLGTGYAAKKASESITNRSVENLANIIARGGYRLPAVQNAVQRLTAAKRDTLSRMLMTMGIQFGTAASAEANP